jgi:hypothetical protein
MEKIKTVDQLNKNWRNHFLQWWHAGMPGFNNVDKACWKQLVIKFKTKQDREHFSSLGENFEISEKTSFMFYPKKHKANLKLIRYFEPEPIKQTKYPIYIISKGRASYGPHTAKYLTLMGIDFKIAVEPQEVEEYKKSPFIKQEQIIVLPFSNHGKGSGPARNYCWEHSKALGYQRHWLLDDNIDGFERLHNNKRYMIERGSTCFRSIEDFVDRYENVGLAAMQYKFFANEINAFHPYILNTRVMSCILIDNNLDIRWRCKYNEDVDLSIRTLKQGYVTMLFYAFLCRKMETGTMKGGNTQEIYNDYKENASFNKSEMLYKMHPECVELKYSYGRVHHQVNLDKIINEKTGISARQNIPILKNNAELLNGKDNYGMFLKRELGTVNEYIDYEFSKIKYPTGRKSLHS